MSIWMTLQARWRALAVREQRLLTLAALVVGVALIWWWLLAAPLALLKTTDAQRLKVDRDMRAMQSMAAEAASLQGQARVAPQDAARLLQTSAQQLMGNSGQLLVLGDRATLTLKGAGADALGHWLAQARQNAQALPVEVRISRSGNAVWDGSVVLHLPAR